MDLELLSNKKINVQKLQIKKMNKRIQHINKRLKIKDLLIFQQMRTQVQQCYNQQYIQLFKLFQLIQFIQKILNFFFILENFQFVYIVIKLKIFQSLLYQKLVKKSSLTPSPGRYRSGKILDFLEKKLSHAKLSQKELHYGQSKEYIKKNNTNQALQISIDFGDQENIQSQNKIEIQYKIKILTIEINNHNFFKQTKFIS